MREPVTAHCVIRNEDIWIWYVIQSVLPYVDKLLICDTGSEDKTLEIIDTIKSDKIQVIRKEKLTGLEFQAKFTDYKNELIDMTTTPWWFVLDGDEVYHDAAMKNMVEKLSEIPKQWNTLSVRMKYFSEHLHKVTSERVIEHYRFVRTGTHRWALGFGQILLTPAPAKNQRLAHWFKQEGWDFDCFHFSFLQRSSTHDAEAYQRIHRSKRPINEHLWYNGSYGYDIKYPEVFYRDDVPEIVKKINPYIEQVHKSKLEFGM